MISINFRPQKWQNSQKSKFRAYKFAKIAVFETSKSVKIGFTENLTGSKIIIFHTVVRHLHFYGKLISHFVSQMASIEAQNCCGSLYSFFVPFWVKMQARLKVNHRSLARFHSVYILIRITQGSNSKTFDMNLETKYFSPNT